MPTWKKNIFRRRHEQTGFRRWHLLFFIDLSFFKEKKEKKGKKGKKSSPKTLADAFLAAVFAGFDRLILFQRKKKQKKKRRREKKRDLAKSTGRRVFGGGICWFLSFLSYFEEKKKERKKKDLAKSTGRRVFGGGGCRFGGVATETGRSRGVHVGAARWARPVSYIYSYFYKIFYILYYYYYHHVLHTCHIPCTHIHSKPAHPHSKHTSIYACIRTHTHTHTHTHIHTCNLPSRRGGPPEKGPTNPPL